MESRTSTSLKTKLTFFAALLVVFVVSSLSYYLRQSQRNAILIEQERAQEDMVKALRAVAKDGILVDDETLVVNYMNLLKKDEAVEYAMILSPDGRVQIHTDALQIGQRMTDQATSRTLGHKIQHSPLQQEVALPNGGSAIDLSLPVSLGADAKEITGFARIGFNKEVIAQRVAESLQEVDRQIMGAFFLALLLGLVGAYLLALFITRPIERLRRGAKLIGDGDLNHRITVNTSDELRDLADEFNIMGEKLAELDRMKQDFVSNVTHELRSPLTSLRGYADLLLKGAAGDLTDLQKDYVSIVKNSSVRLGRFIDNLLDVAKIEAHKLKLQPEPQDVFEAAHEMEVLFKPQLDEKKLKFINGVPKTGLQAYVDKDKFIEILINLTSNAIKFTPENGQIRIAAAENASLIRMSVEDSGIGIPADMKDKVFSKFEQVKRTEGMARNQKGTGLGLTIVKGIIEAGGGKIWVESPGPLGKGSAFFFTVQKLTAELQSKLDNE